MDIHNMMGAPAQSNGGMDDAFGTGGMSGFNSSTTPPHANGAQMMNQDFSMGGGTAGGGHHQNQPMGENGMAPPQPFAFSTDSTQNYMSNGQTAGMNDMSPPRGYPTPNGSNGAVSQGQNDPRMQQKAMHRQQRLLLLRHASKCTYADGKCPITPHCASMKHVWNHIGVCKDPRCSVQHCLSSRSVLSHFRKCKDPQCMSCEPIRQSMQTNNMTPPPAPRSNGFNGGNGMDMSTDTMMQQSNDPSQNFSQQQRHRHSAGSDMSGQSRGSSSSRDHESSEARQKRTRHKQNLLLLLRHASKCTYEVGKCTSTPHCAKFKQVWNHITACRDQHCTTKHCVSSRSVLSHYRKCKDVRCPCCEPVRQSIKRSREKKKEMSPNPYQHMDLSRKRQRSDDMMQSPSMSSMSSMSSMNSTASSSLNTTRGPRPQKRVKIDPSWFTPESQSPFDPSLSPVPKELDDDLDSAGGGLDFERPISPVAFTM